MISTVLIISIIALCALCALVPVEYKRILMMFQQNSYRPERYRRWLKQSADSTTKIRLFGIFILLFSLAGFTGGLIPMLLVALFGICGTWYLASKKYKKPLVFTRRAIRLYVTMLILVLLVVGLALVASCNGLFGQTAMARPVYVANVALLALYCGSHLVLQCAAWLLRPVESHINAGYYNDAARKLAGVDGIKVIGITGSYGKTSTKHYLYRILSEQYETLMTPGSFNTTLGVVRTIREYLKPYHEVFIVEMGAKQSGDIAEICNLVHPQAGIITAVGPQHLETFGTVECVRDTKFELIDSLPKDGTAVVNNDYPLIADRPIDNCTALRYSCHEGSGANYYADNIRYTPTGTSFDVVCPDGKRLSLETVLMGEYNISNLVASVAMALTLGVTEDRIRYAVSRIEPVEHRLSKRTFPNGLTILDDAFNSNPAGAAMAVDVLSHMDTGRRFIITPGMIELGERQYELNKALGARIGKAGIDKALVVGSYNRDALIEGMSESGMVEGDILTFDTFLEANAWLVANATRGDVALIENDLPDTFK